MDKIIQMHKKIAPDFIVILEERYTILRNIKYSQPIGRRSLAGLLGLGERTVRAQVDFLKSLGLIDFSPLGMTITEDGENILSDLSEYVHSLHKLTTLENDLAEKLNLKKVIVIPGNSDTDEVVCRELGRAASLLIGKYLQTGMIMAVSGGSTMAIVAEAINAVLPSTIVVPARGGLGERVEYQANTIAAVAARRLGGKYKLLHVPDGLGQDTLEAMLAADHSIRTVAEMVKRADVVVYSIGQAAKMAERRGMSEEFIHDLVEQGAVGEALGHYFSLDGKMIHITSSLGLHMHDFANIGTVIAIAGGEKKAAAIVAVMRATGKDVLVTDEAAAKVMQKIINRL